MPKWNIAYKCNECAEEWDRNREKEREKKTDIKIRTVIKFVAEWRQRNGVKKKNTRKNSSAINSTDCSATNFGEFDIQTMQYRAQYRKEWISRHCMRKQNHKFNMVSTKGRSHTYGKKNHWELHKMQFQLKSRTSSCIHTHTHIERLSLSWARPFTRSFVRLLLAKVKHYTNSALY